MKNSFVFISLLCLSWLLVSCDDTEKAVGRTNISITDGPIDAENVEAVYITILGVEMNGPDGWATVETFEEPVVIDLLSYQNGESYFLTEGTVTAGAYSEIRLLLDIQERVNGVISNEGCFIQYTDGSTQQLFVPSGGQSGYKAKGNFTIPAGGVVSLTLDFDLRKAVVESGNSGKFILKPVVRLIANENAAMISGEFDAEGTVYDKIIVYAYADDTFTESELAEPAPEEVRFTNATTSGTVGADGNFNLAFLDSGTYDLYFAAYDANGEFVELIGNLPDVELSAGVNLSLTVQLSLLN